MDAWHQEIVELHEFFEELFLGTVISLDRAEAALAPEFTMAGPHGTIADRATVLAQLEAGIAHTDELRITIPHARLLFDSGDLVVAEYVERHDLRGGRHNERLTTVIFRRDPDGPNGLRWLRAQETFIDGASTR